MIKQEIDLLELCRDINEDTFKNESKQSAVNKLAAAKAQPKKKVQGSGQFCLTTKGVPEQSASHTSTKTSLQQVPQP
jgi:hypothetical protein